MVRYVRTPDQFRDELTRWDREELDAELPEDNPCEEDFVHRSDPRAKGRGRHEPKRERRDEG